MSITAAIPLADTWGMHGDFGWGWMALMMVMMLLFWGAVIFGVVWLIRGADSGFPWVRERPVSKEDPIAILDRRFAEGEITEEDYRARREVLGSRRGAVGPA
jgi:putative membrane protein